MRHATFRIASSVACAATATSASGAITAHWRQNFITPAAIASSPVLANMQSWSLMAVTDGD